MENNDLITIATIEERKELLINMEGIEEPSSECCVYRVPNDLRQLNEAAYTPQVVSIGPLHHGKIELADMEKQKIRYQKEFNKRIKRNAWEQFITFLEKNENRIRSCYEEMPKLTQLDFITMILYDAAFIIEFLLREYLDEDEFLTNKRIVRAAIVRDFVLLENQLPYFVIEKLYMLSFPNNSSNERQCPSFFELSWHSLRDPMYFEIPVEGKVKHFTDLIRYVMTKTYPRSRSREWLIDLPSAVKLHKSGVKFKNRIEGECWLDVRFEKKNVRIPWFGVSELQIPGLQVYDGTECIIRNVMALEQCHYPNETHVCNFVDFMNLLINTEEDVNLLVEAGIIYNNVGDDARIANMFNTLGDQMELSPSCYSDIGQHLKEHHANTWNHAKATLKNVYFGNLWRGTGTIAAIVLLVLTLIQTICSILQVV